MRVSQIRLSKVGTGRLANLLKTAKNQSHQGVVPFWTCPNFGLPLFGRFSHEMDGEASHTKGSSGIFVRF